MQKGWIDEKQFFKNGVFPDVTTGGDVGHYSVMICRSVTKIGCAAAEGTGWKFVCHYSPEQNMIGDRVC